MVVVVQPVTHSLLHLCKGEEGNGQRGFSPSESARVTTGSSQNFASPLDDINVHAARAPLLKTRTSRRAPQSKWLDSRKNYVLT